MPILKMQYTCKNTKHNREVWEVNRERDHSPHGEVLRARLQQVFWKDLTAGYKPEGGQNGLIWEKLGSSKEHSTHQGPEAGRV